MNLVAALLVCFCVLTVGDQLAHRLDVLTATIAGRTCK